MKIIDLTHEINKSISLFPGTEDYEVTKVATIEKDQYLEHKLIFTTHIGTHIDSPSHILKNGKRLNEYNADKFVGNGIVIDVRGHKSITKELIQKNTNVLNAEFILFYTGLSKFFGKEGYFDPFPILDLLGCEYLVELSKDILKGIGVDCFSIDTIEPLSIQNHIQILKEDLVIIENLKGIEELIDKEFIFSALPLKMERIEGSPVRAVALLK